MGYIGKAPTDVPLDSDVLSDGIVTTAKLTDANVTDAKIVDMSSSKLTCALLAIDGSALTGVSGGKMVQVVNVQDGTLATGTTAMPLDNTIPQITEGTEFMTLAITPTNSSNKLLIEVVAIVHISSNVPQVALFQDSTSNALASALEETGGHAACISLNHYMTAGTTSSTTFKVRIGGTTGTTYFNGSGSGAKHGGVLASSVTITEIQV